MKIGEELSIEVVIEDSYLASNWESGNVRVFATPCMIGFMEQASLNLAQKYLPEGQTTVGTVVNVEHLKPSVPGQTIRFVSRLKNVDGRILTFNVEAYNETGAMIGRGEHQRAVVDLERFYAKLNAPL